MIKVDRLDHGMTAAYKNLVILFYEQKSKKKEIVNGNFRNININLNEMIFYNGCRFSSCNFINNDIRSLFYRCIFADCNYDTATIDYMFECIGV